MKKILFFLASAMLISCSSESNDDGEQKNNTNGNKLVKKEYVSDNHNVQYRYNEKNLLSETTDIFLEEEIHDVITYSYDSNGNLIKEYYDSKNSNSKLITDFFYDNNERLMKMVSVSSGSYTNTTTTLFSYSANKIVVNINNNGYSRVVSLETNNLGLITKMTKEDSSSILNYDSNGNIETINVYDNEGTMLHTQRYTYDNKPNPFYGQLESHYIPSFLDAMSDAYYGEIVFDIGLNRYTFPFFKNNITSVKLNDYAERIYSYSYDNNNYPINVIEKRFGNNRLIYDIEYY